MKEIGISINFSNISDDDYVAIEEKVSEYLQKKGWLKHEFITGLERHGVLSADR